MKRSSCIALAFLAFLALLPFAHEAAAHGHGGVYFSGGLVGVPPYYPYPPYYPAYPYYAYPPPGYVYAPPAYRVPPPVYPAYPPPPGAVAPPIIGGIGIRIH